MNHKHNWVQCELLKNSVLSNFIIKLFYLILEKLKSLKIPNIKNYLNINLLNNKYTKEKIIQTNGINCKISNVCEGLIEINIYEKFYNFIKENNITIMQITGIIYNMSSSEIIYRVAIKNDTSLSKEIISIYSELFGDKITSFNEIEKIAKKSEGDWFIPLIYIYGKKERTNIVNAGLNYDKIYVREALGYSRPMETKDFKIYKLKNSDCFKSNFDNNKIVLGDSYFKIVKNGVFENIMKKNKKEMISGFSGSCVMLYNFIFNILKILPKNKKNESLILLMIILDFYPFHHSISEILVTYSRESQYLKKYYLNENEMKYLNNYLKYINIKINKNKTQKHKKNKNKTFKTFKYRNKNN
jgi:hypothetical protein